MATIKFLDGTEITAEVNGTCYIVDEKPDFPSDLSEVTIEDDGNVQIIQNARIIECKDLGAGFWFNIIPQSDADKLEQARADIDYLLLITE